MQFTNLNFLTVSIFVILFIITIFLVYKKYYSQVNFNKKFKLLSSNKFFYIKYIFLILSFFIILFSIFWLKYWEKIIKSEEKWIDIIFVLDVSKSMNVADIKDWNYNYTRLDVSKKSIWDFVVKNSQNRFWLVIFAWDAISTVPLTNDNNLFLTFLEGVDYRNLTNQGSDFKKAIDLWIERFIWENDRSKALIFISDWWDTWDNVNFKIKKDNSIAFWVIWIWTEKWWKIIKWVDFFGKYIYQKYKWNFIISKLNIDNLKSISSILWWNFIKLEDIWDLEKLNKDFSKLEKKAFEKTTSKKLSDSGRFLTIISFILFIIYLTIHIINIRKISWKS